MQEGTEALIDNLTRHGYSVYWMGGDTYTMCDGSQVVGFVKDTDRASEPEPFSWFEKA